MALGLASCLLPQHERLISRFPRSDCATLLVLRLIVLHNSQSARAIVSDALGCIAILACSYLGIARLSWWRPWSAQGQAAL